MRAIFSASAHTPRRSEAQASLVLAETRGHSGKEFALRNLTHSFARPSLKVSSEEPSGFPPLRGAPLG